MEFGNGEWGRRVGGDGMEGGKKEIAALDGI